MPRLAVGTVAYVRFHGADEKYRGGYPDSALRIWWSWMEEQVMRGKDLYVYFNNDFEAQAVQDALRLTKKAGLNFGAESLV